MLFSSKKNIPLQTLDDWDIAADPRQIQGISKRLEDIDAENFFSNKKKKWFILWTAFLILIIGIAVKSLLNISLFDLFARLKSSSSVPYFSAVMIFGFMTFFACEIFIRSAIIKYKLSSKLGYVSKFEWFNFSAISFLIQSITPFAIGSEPYHIWWLSKRGVSVRDATATTAVCSLCWFIAQFFVTWPSFIYLTIQNWDKISTLKIHSSYWLVLVGLLVDIFVSSFIFIISYVNKAHFFISRLTNEVRRHLGFNYLTRDEVFNKYLRQSTFKNLYIQFLFQKSTLKVIFIYFMNNLWIYMMFALIHKIFLASISLEGSNFILNSFNLINVATTSNNFFPLPSAEGSLQVTLQSMMSGIFDYSGSNSSAILNENAHLTKVNDQTIFMWRFFYKYMGLLISLATVYLFGFNVKSKESESKNNRLGEKLNGGTTKNPKNHQIHYELIF